MQFEPYRRSSYPGSPSKDQSFAAKTTEKRLYGESKPYVNPNRQEWDKQHSDEEKQRQDDEQFQLRKSQQEIWKKTMNKNAKKSGCQIF